MVVQIHNEELVSDTGFDRAQIVEVLNFVQNTLDDYPKVWDKISDMEVGLVFVDRQDIAGLNYEYRKKSEVTDVLSFKLSDRLGEVYICPDYIEERLVKMLGAGNVGTKENSIELLRMFIHGMLHLAGYDHKSYLDWTVTADNTYYGDEEMFVLQEKILSTVLEKYKA